MTASLNGRRRLTPGTIKRLMAGCFVFAALAIAAGSALEQQLLGVGLYVVGMVAGFAVPALTEYTLFDERDDSIHQRSSALTLMLFGILAALVFPSLVVLSTTPRFAWGPATETLSLATAAVYLTYALALLYYR